MDVVPAGRTSLDTGVSGVFAEIARLNTRLNPDELNAVAAVLAAPARRWFLTGQGRSGLVAAMVAMRLMHLGRTAHLVGEATAPAITAGDGLIVISGSGATPTSLARAATAQRVGATVVAVTRDGDSELARLARPRLEIPAEASAQLGGNLFEQSALLVLDGIVNMLATRTPGAAQTLRRRHSNLE